MQFTYFISALMLGTAALAFPLEKRQDDCQASPPCDTSDDCCETYECVEVLPSFSACVPSDLPTIPTPSFPSSIPTSFPTPSIPTPTFPTPTITPPSFPFPGDETDD